MIAHWQWLLKHATRQLWFRATVFSILGVVAALLALVFKPYFPEAFAVQIGADAVDKILGIISTSMLAVTIFSLDIMVSAYNSAASNITPRATPLLIEDSITQNALGTFLGSFLFSLVGIIALSTGIYGDQGRVVLFAATLVVIILIVYTLLRWINHLAILGRIGETTDRVEQAASQALQQRTKLPYLGGRPLPGKDAIPSNLSKIFPREIGYIQLVDMRALENIASDHDCEFYLHVLPGSFVDPSEPLVSSTQVDEKMEKRILDAFTIGIRRSFDQDPRFGLSVLSEIAARALPNDPGTAIDVIGRSVRILYQWTNRSPDGAENPPECPHVFVPALQLRDLFDDLFSPIARDGAMVLEVGIRLQKALASLGRVPDPEFRDAAREHAQMALRYAEAVPFLEEDKRILRQLASEVGLSSS
ncbi:MAG: DUF2254 domain-containing protein [Xanthomonadaceae bacterium]|nr:DUF2254 domain-containing protein [Xanthomonadaceae bacterium]